MAKNKTINMVKSQVIYKDYSKDAERTALVSGENLSHMFGKIARWYTDISWVGHTHTEANITDFGTYAGASTKGGAATSANKLNIGSADIGSETKPVYFSYLTGKPVACTYSLNASVPANAVFTDINVKQSPSTANESREVLFASNTGNTETTGTVGKSNKLYFNPNTGALTATSFSGSLAASNLTGTIDAGRLPTTAVTAGSYGPAAGGTLTYGGTFDVPYVTVDKYGRLTNASTKTFTMPAQYTHPSYTSKTSGLYKITVDATGHVSGTAAVTASDLPAHTHPYLPESTVTGSPDLDTYLTTGVYHIKTQTSEHAPTTNHATLFVDGTVGTPYQLFIPDVSNGVWYSRYKSGSSAWSSWLSLKMTDTVYTHPTYTSKTSGLYKITVDGTGHVSATAAVAAADLPSHTHSYLPLAGGTMTGVITLPKDKYRSSECGLDCNNSNIINANNIKFGDTPDTDGSEGIHYYRSATTWDSLWGKDGALYFTPNFPTGTTHYTIYHSGNLTYSTIGAAPTSHTHQYAKSSSVNGPAYSVEGSQGATNVDRHIWFSFDTDETRRAYSDNFKYNPDTNIITVGAVGISPSFAVQTGSSKVARITFETFITWLTNTKKAVPKSYPVHKILRTTWAYADNDILQITADGTNYEIQLAGVVIEIHGTIATYNTGEWRMKIYTAPAVNGFAPTTGYTKAPVSSIFTYTCNGSGYAPTWRLLSYSNHTHNYIPNTQAGLIAAINLLQDATATPIDDCYYITQDNAAANNNYYRRKHSALWAYVNGKISGTTSGSGNAVTSISYANGVITATKGSTFSLSNHTHSNYLSTSTKYAISDSVGGVAVSSYSNHLRFNNEMNISKLSASGHVWFGYRWDTDGTTELGRDVDIYITRYKFGNADGALAEVEASAFIGNASSATTATTATTASKLGTNAGSNISPVYFSGGIPVACKQVASGAYFSTVPYVRSDGVVEIGRYIDFHTTNTSTAVNYRIDQWTTESIEFNALGTNNRVNIYTPGSGYTRLSFQVGNVVTPGIIVKPLTTSGTLMQIECGGNMVIGSGESPTTLSSNSYDSLDTSEKENLYLAADNEIHLVSGVQTYAGRKIIKIDTSGNIQIGNGQSVVQLQNSGSNYTEAISWWKGGTNPGNYGPSIGQHNTGDTDGAICILPYHTSTDPWGASVGLYISKTRLLYNGTAISLNGHAHSYIPLSGSTAITGELASSSSNAFRAYYGGYGAFFRNDGSHVYLLFTDKKTDGSEKTASWNSLRPFYCHLSSGYVTMENGLSVKSGLTASAITTTGYLKLGYSNDSTLPSTGIYVNDIRSVNVPASGIGGHLVNFYFHMADSPDTSRWWSIMHVKGWEGAYCAWELAGTAHNDDARTRPLYVRCSNTNTAWGSWRKIYDTSNKPTLSELGAAASSHTHNYVPNTRAGMIAGINLLDTATAAPTDDSYYIAQENNASTTNYYRRKHSGLWSYIKGKADSTYAAKSHSHNYAGSTSAGGDAIAAQSLRVTHGNEINSSKPGDYTYIWFFYRWNDGGTEDTSGSKYISTIYFGNGNGAGTNTSVGRFADLQFNNIAAGTLRHTGAVASWWNDRNAAMLYQTYGDSNYRPLWGTETKDNCSWCCGNYNNNNLMFNYISASTYNSGMNPSVYYQISFTTEAKIEARGYNVINNGSGRLVMDYAGISMTNSRTGSWAAGIDMKNASGTLLSAIGFYGTDTALTYTYLGGAYNDPIIKLESSGYATFKDGMKVNNNISLQETKNIILRPNHSSYTAGIGYDTSGNECIAIWAKNTVTRLRWYAGTDMSSLPSGTMMGITPDFEISKASGTAKGYIAGDSIVTYKILWSGSTSCTARSSTSITLTTSISANKYRSIRVVWNCGTYTGISEFRADTLNVTNNVPTGSDATTTNMIQFKIASDGKSITVGPGTAAITMLQVAGVCVI